MGGSCRIRPSVDRWSLNSVFALPCHGYLPIQINDLHLMRYPKYLQPHDMHSLTSKSSDSARKAPVGTPFFSARPIVQAKLSVNTPGDAFEREADAMADHVMRKAAGATPGQQGTLAVQRKHAPPVQRKCAHCGEEEQLQRMATGDGADVTDEFADQLDASRGNGSPLPTETRAFMENAFNSDFSNVNIHTGSRASSLNRQIQAKAFTHGSDIYFNEGQYNPSSDSGKHLLAHELTHVIQQGKSAARSNNTLARKSTTNEMIPGYSQQHGYRFTNTGSSVIQRAKIDHRTLTWADFSGPVPKNPHHDAATYSGLTDLDLSPWPFNTLTEVDNGTTATVNGKVVDCEKGMAKDKNAAKHPNKYKAYKVDITPDISKLEVKAYMWQEKSWAKPRLYDATAMAAHADTFVPGCEKYFNKAQKAAEKSCAKAVKDCEKAFKKNIASYDIYDLSIGSKDDCGQLKDACIADQMSGLEYEQHNHNGASASATELGDCSTTFRQAMIDTVLADSSSDLLNHEQRHFDITHQIAERITSELQALASSFTVTEVEACSEGKALSAANKVLKTQRKQLKNKMNAIKGQLSTYQTNYDNETNHSVNTLAQQWWNDNIDAGLPKKSGKKDKFK